MIHIPKRLNAKQLSFIPAGMEKITVFYYYYYYYYHYYLSSQKIQKGLESK